jgi:predicted GNAT family acetyltransferase
MFASAVCLTPPVDQRNDLIKNRMVHTGLSRCKLDQFVRSLDIEALHRRSAAAPTVHPLDRVIWEALNSRQQHFADGDERARRYFAEVAPFAAIVDETTASYHSLATLIPPGDRVALFTKKEMSPPSRLSVAKRDLVDQMVLETSPPLRGETPLLALGPEDLSEMRELVDLTRPGPFGPRTVELGSYLGIRIDGTLVAMAGERMKLDGFAEISAVCVHPAYRGKGFVAELVCAIARLIIFRLEMPFLHVFASNTPAIALYERLGFVRRRRMQLAVLEQPTP